MAEPFFNIELLPARNGDCIWVEYGCDNDVYRLLIDGGPVSTFEYISQRIEQMPSDNRALELVVLTHVDADHIEGLVRLFADNPLPFQVERVWFNGWRQMSKRRKLLGSLQGEFLSVLLEDRAFQAWNSAMEPLVVRSGGELPSFNITGGMKLTLLSPNRKKLDKMAKFWKSAIERQGIAPSDLDAAWDALTKKKKFLPQKGLLGTAPSLDKLLKKQFLKDAGIPNGSSIAFLAEYAGKSVLFLGDAHPDIITESLQRICKERNVNRLKVSAVKVAHHGSKRNTSADLLKLVDCPWYLISTNGDQTEHPDPECMARIIEFGRPRRLYFNYETRFTKPWISSKTAADSGYKAVVRKENRLSLIIRLLPGH